jgi:hypothetical protein
MDAIRKASARYFFMRFEEANADGLLDSAFGLPAALTRFGEDDADGLLKSA